MLYLMSILLCINVICFRTISSACVQSYMTICDNFEDLDKYEDKENLQQLIIGSDKANFSTVNLMKALRINQYNKLTTLLVLRRINKLELTYAYECTYYDTPLQYVTYYGNVMTTIAEYHFPVHPMKRMSLVNNQIEEIKGGAFNHHEIEEFDASDNLLDVVQSDSLPRTQATKVITLRRNRLSHVEPGSFSSKLKVLNLDHNNFRHILDEVLTELGELQELTLSHNRFNVMPNIRQITKLVVFDLSHNAITDLGKDTFKDKPHLQHVDLSNNKIHMDNVLNSIVMPRSNLLTILLAFNRLRYLNLTGLSLEKTRLVLHGNPWDCNVWDVLKTQIQGHENKCDLEFISSGAVPFCINYRADNYVFTSLWENDIDRFHDVVNEGAKNATCRLTPSSTHLLHALNFGCVA